MWIEICHAKSTWQSLTQTQEMATKNESVTKKMWNLAGFVAKVEY